jgi:ketosteroid isomerase-like protein
MSNDVIQIQHTLAACCHYVDRGTADQVATLFAPEAVLMPYYDGKYEVRGREAIRGWFTFYHENLRAKVTDLKHLTHSMMIDVDGDAASSVCYLTAYFTSKEDNVAHQVIGTYYDELVSGDDVWLFQERRIEVQYLTPLAHVIDNMEPMGYPGATN